MGGRVVTFYSYKGGTGRSMALANVAWVLASAGQKVLVVDWDLEAPGLHRYFRPFLPDKQLTRIESQGVIDFVVDFAERLAQQAGSTSPPAADWHRRFADISKWSQRLLWPSGADASTTLGGFIDFVPAGRQGAQYARKVNAFDWARFYEQSNGGAFMELVRANMAARYDWVLIDSRTGVSDTSGICTVQLPDMLVVCFTLNYQSIEGASAVAASARAARTDRPLRVLPLPTRLDGNEANLMASMLRYAENAFTPLMSARDLDGDYWREMGVPYFSRYAYAEKLAPFEENPNVSTSTLPSIERLAARLTDGRVKKLGSLPVDDWRETRAEFERLPDEVSRESAPVSATPSSWATWLRRIPLRYPATWWLGLASGVVVAFIFIRPSTSPNTVVRRLIADARADLAANRRPHAALLIAEAASRMGPEEVVAQGVDAGGDVYAALQVLQPLRLAPNENSTGPMFLLFSPDGQHAVTFAERAPARLFPFPPPELSAGAPVGYGAGAFLPSAELLATGTRGAGVSFVNTATGRYVGSWTNPNPDDPWVMALATSPDGRYVAIGTDDGLCYLYDVRDPRANAFVWPTKRDGSGPGRRISSIVFLASTPRPQVAIANGDGAIHVWSPGGDAPGSIAVETNVMSLAVSPDGKILAIADGAAVRLVHVEESNVFRSETRVEIGGATALAFSAEGTRIVVGAAHVKIVDVATRKELQSVDVSSMVGSVALTPDGKYLGIGTAEGAWWVLVEPPDRPLTLSASDVRVLACSQVPADMSLTSEEWQKYFGKDEPVRYTCRRSPPPAAAAGAR